MTSADDIFPKPGLRLVYTRACSASERHALIRHIDALLIHGVTGFVHIAEETITEIIFLHARGDAHIAQRELRHERMMGLIDASAVEIITKFSDYFLAEG